MSKANGQVDLAKILNETALASAKGLPYSHPHLDVGQPLTIRTITGRERDLLETGRIRRLPKAGGGLDKDDINWSNYRAFHVVFFLGDGEGKRVFNDTQIGLVGNWPAAIVDDVYTKGLEHNGMSAGADKEAEKNSNAATAASGSTSPATSE